jgi:hypothetical protein
MKLKEFNKKIREWCPNGEFREIYKINHPNENKNEVHFIKNGIRVCCVKNFNDLYFYLNAECFLKNEVEVLTLKSGKYKLFDTKKRDMLLELFSNKIKILENKNSIFDKICMFFKANRTFRTIK